MIAGRPATRPGVNALARIPQARATGYDVR